MTGWSAVTWERDLRDYSEQGVTPDLPIKTRFSAKPRDNDGDAEPLDESIVGDPKLDPVLAAALRAARGRSQAAR